MAPASDDLRACHLMGGAALPLSDDDAEVARMAPINCAPAL
jgi:hypothetical protein